MRSVIILSFTLLASAAPVLACRCGDRPSVKEAVARSELIFVGRVTKLSIDYRPAGISGRQTYVEIVMVEFSDSEVFKGPAAKDGRTSVITPSSGPACGYAFQIGEQYLVYATHADGEFRTDICERTRRRFIVPQDQDMTDITKVVVDDAMKTEIPEIRRNLRIE